MGGLHHEIGRCNAVVDPHALIVGIEMCTGTPQADEACVASDQGLTVGLAGGRRAGSALAAGPGCDLPLFAVTLRCAFNRGNPLFGATTPAHVHVLKAS